MKNSLIQKQSFLTMKRTAYVTIMDRKGKIFSYKDPGRRLKDNTFNVSVKTEACGDSHVTDYKYYLKFICFHGYVHKCPNKICSQVSLSPRVLLQEQ